MINIKSFVKRKGVTINNQTNSNSSSGSSSTTSLADTWFYYNDDNGFVTCRYPLCSVDNVVAFADGTEAGGGSGGGSNVEVVDNLESTDTEAALSANQGRVLKDLIDNVQTQGGGTSPSSVDWSNIQNKPSTFTPSAHTHAISDVTGLQNNLNTLSNNIATTSSNLTAHINDTSVHVTSTQQNILSQLTLEQIQFIVRLMQICTIDSNGNITFNGNVNSRQNVTAMV